MTVSCVEEASAAVNGTVVTKVSRCVARGVGEYEYLQVSFARRRSMLCIHLPLPSACVYTIDMRRSCTILSLSTAILSVYLPAAGCSRRKKRSDDSVSKELDDLNSGEKQGYGTTAVRVKYYRYQYVLL